MECNLDITYYTHAVDVPHSRQEGHIPRTQKPSVCEVNCRQMNRAESEAAGAVEHGQQRPLLNLVPAISFLPQCSLGHQFSAIFLQLFLLKLRYMVNALTYFRYNMGGHILCKHIRNGMNNKVF